MAALERHMRDGVVFWTSPALASLAVTHAFSTRHGGVSQGPFHSLNLGRSTGAEGDDARRVAENLRRFQTAALDGRRTVSVRQVHGAAVFVTGGREHLPGRQTAERKGTQSAGASRPPPDAVRSQSGACEADAIVGDDPDRALLVRVADCAPVLLACPRSGVVAAVHAGWRGVVAGVVESAVTSMADQGAVVDDIRAAIGPCIGEGAFEVGDEVVEAFRHRDLGAFVHRRQGARARIDLAASVRALLERMGIDPTHVDGGELCTVEREDDFFSYRRDGARSGRMAAAIAAIDRRRGCAGCASSRVAVRRDPRGSEARSC